MENIFSVDESKLALELPQTFEEREQMLCTILQDGIQQLLKHARKNELLKPPYGRPPQPTPLMTEEEFMRSGAWKDQNLNCEPKFEYNYGFNALKYLADYIKWAHPDSVLQRLRKKEFEEKKREELRQYSQYRESIRLKLVEKVNCLQSGLFWGPYTSPVSTSSVMVITQPFKPGMVTIELSLDSEFSNITDKREYYHDPYENEDESSQEYPTEFVPLKLVIDQLTPGKYYHIRCRGTISAPQESTNEENNNDSSTDLKYRYGSFWTLPSEFVLEQESTESSVQAARIFNPVSIIGIGINSNTQATSLLSENSKDFSSIVLGDDMTRESKNASVVCILGDPLAASSKSVHRPVYSHMSYSGFYQQLTTSLSSMALKSSFVLGWNDTREGSERDLLYEEYVHHAYRHEVKHYDKKHKKTAKTFGSRLKLADLPPPPVLQRPPLTNSIASLSEGFPVKLNEDVTVNMYRSMVFGPDIELFILDTRNGLLGTQQVKWLKKSLSNSLSVWKIVMMGCPYGAIVTSTDTIPAPSVNSPIALSRPSSAYHPERPTLEEEFDDKGRSKSSLQYVMSYLQLKTSKDFNDDDKSSLEEVENIQSIQANGNMNKTMNDPTAMLSPTSMNSGDNFDFDPAGDRISRDQLNNLTVLTTVDEDIESHFIQSGIVLLTGGTSKPYVATYDPNCVGKPFVCEVNTGLSVQTTGEQSTSLNTSINFDSSSSPDVLYDRSSATDETAVEDRRYWTSLNLRSDGSLNVKLFSRLTDNSVQESPEKLEFDIILTTSLAH